MSSSIQNLQKLLICMQKMKYASVSYSVQTHCHTNKNVNVSLLILIVLTGVITLCPFRSHQTIFSLKHQKTHHIYDIWDIQVYFQPQKTTFFNFKNIFSVDFLVDENMVLWQTKMDEVERAKIRWFPLPLVFSWSHNISRNKLSEQQRVKNDYQQCGHILTPLTFHWEMYLFITQY